MTADFTTGARPVKAARGTELTAKSWQTEAPLRMLMNNLDPEVAERPDDLVVYGGTGRAVRSWAAFDAITRTLETMEKDETLLVQSGKPVGVFRTNEWAPRVLLANSNLVGDWATWPEFRRLEAEGLMMYGQMTAGSWIYIGTQGILQGTYETFAAVGNKLAAAGRIAAPAAGSTEGPLAGTLTLTGGCGGMGGAQPLAVTLNDGACLIVDVDETRLRRRAGKRYLDEVETDLDTAIAKVQDAKDERRGWSVGYVGNAAEVFPELLARHTAGELSIDIVTDQTSAHDPLSYLPEGITVAEWHTEAAADPEGFTKKAQASMARQVQAMVEFQDAGAEVFDYGNSIRDEARTGGYDRAFEFPGFVPAYIRPLFCEGLGPFRWVALSGDPEDIAVTDAAIKELFPENTHLHKWIDAAQERVEFEGLPATDLLAGLRRTRQSRAALQPARQRRQGQGPHRDRPRPPRLRLRGLPVPGNRGHGRRLGRDRGLAAAERPAQHRLRRDLGLDPPRRRRRHRPVHPRRPGRRRRRHRPRRAKTRTPPHQRPRHGRHPPRRRRLRPRPRRRQRTRRPHPHARRPLTRPPDSTKIGRDNP